MKTPQQRNADFAAAVLVILATLWFTSNLQVITETMLRAMDRLQMEIERQ